MTISRAIRLSILFLILGCTVGCDQTSKHIARAALINDASIRIPGGFGEFRLASNPGSFLSFGDSLPGPLRLGLLTIGVGLGLLGLLAFLLDDNKLRWLPFIGLALVLAGGMSNLIDRVTQHGLVTDFVFVRVGRFHTGVFNAADFIIMLGVATIACGLWRPQPTPTPGPLGK